MASSLEQRISKDVRLEGLICDIIWYHIIDIRQAPGYSTNSLSNGTSKMQGSVMDVRHEYRIYVGLTDNQDQQLRWIESIVGLEAASERVRQIAGEKPGSYFVFDASHNQIVDSLDTSN